MSTAGAIFTGGVILWLAFGMLALGLCNAASTGDEQMEGWDDWDDFEPLEDVVVRFPGTDEQLVETLIRGPKTGEALARRLHEGRPLDAA